MSKTDQRIYQIFIVLCLLEHFLIKPDNIRDLVVVITMLVCQIITARGDYLPVFAKVIFYIMVFLHLLDSYYFQNRLPSVTYEPSVFYLIAFSRYIDFVIKNIFIAIKNLFKKCIYYR